MAYHTVRAGETLYWIGRYYSVSWVTLAQANLLPTPSLIYPGQRLCIPGSGSGGLEPIPARTGWLRWSYQVIAVVPNVSVTVLTANFPDNVHVEAYIGRQEAGGTNWKKVADLDSGNGGSFNAEFAIPAEFANTPNLWLRLAQLKKNPARNVVGEAWFGNTPLNLGSGGLESKPTLQQLAPAWVPSIVIVSVSQNSTVTIRMSNLPVRTRFDVLMGDLATRAEDGYYASTIDSGASGDVTAIVTIPSQLFNRNQIAIRVQNTLLGIYGYNWFFNVNTC